MKYFTIFLIFFTQYLSAQKFTLGVRSSYVIPSYSTTYGRFYLIDDKRFVFGLISSQKLDDEIYLHEEVLYEKIVATFGSQISEKKIPMLTIPVFIEYKMTGRFGFEAGLEYNHFWQHNLNNGTNDSKAYSYEALLGLRFKPIKYVAIDCRYLKQLYAKLWGKGHSFEFSVLTFFPF